VIDRCGDRLGGRFGRGRTVSSYRGAVAVPQADTVPAPTAATRRVDPLALGAVAVMVVVWASAFVGIRAARIDLAAGPLSLARLLVGAAVLGLVVAARREPLPPRADVLRLVVCGLLWFGAYNVLLNEAERRVDAGTAAMLVNVGPILIAALAGVLLKEGFPRTLVVGCAVAFVGAVVIGLGTSGEQLDAGWGAALCLGAAATYAGGVIAQKPLLERTSALQITFLACVVGALACLPFAPRLAVEAGHAHASALAWAVYLGVFPTAIGFTLWAYALRRTSAGRMGATTYLVPPVAILVAWVLLGEAPPALALAGGALCLAGVAITRRRRP
jgi:drug/metabolite transporter (DMT)-like permease